MTSTKGQKNPKLQVPTYKRETFESFCIVIWNLEFVCPLVLVIWILFVCPFRVFSFIFSDIYSLQPPPRHPEAPMPSGSRGRVGWGGSFRGLGRPRVWARA